MSTPPNQARVAGSPRDLAVSSRAASMANDILGKGVSTLNPLHKRLKTNKSLRRLRTFENLKLPKSAKEEKKFMFFMTEKL